MAALLAVPACEKADAPSDKSDNATRAVNQASRVPDACADQAGYERLKALVFAKVRDVRSGDDALLDRLADTSAVRMEDPVVKERDDALNVTVCEGRMVIDLPPGAQDAFSGDRQLLADVRFTIQDTGGRGSNYRLDGAEPIIYRLAAIDLKRGTPIAQGIPQPSPSSSHTARPAPSPRATGTSVRAAVATSTRRAASSVPPPNVARWADAEPRLSSRGRPSFDCRDTQSRWERMICRDERLAALDRVAASQYSRTVARTDRQTRSMLRNTQGRFVAARQNCGSSACIARVYQERMNEIDRIAARY